MIQTSAAPHDGPHWPGNCHTVQAQWCSRSGLGRRLRAVAQSSRTGFDAPVDAVTFRRHLAFALVAALPACSSAPEPDRPALPTEGASSSALLGPVGVIEGRVVFEGAPIPEPTSLENTTDPDDCGKVHSLEDILVNPENRGIRNVIVSLADPPLPAGYEPPPSRLVVDNRRCRFEPHVAALTIGGVIEARNSDPFYHFGSLVRAQAAQRVTAHLAVEVDRAAGPDRAS